MEQLQILDMDALTVSTEQFSISAGNPGLCRSKAQISNLALMLQGAITAYTRVGLMMNVRHADLPVVLEILPALQKPTVSSLSDPEWVAVNTIVEEAVVRQIIPKLKAARAQGIVEYPLNKIIY